MSCRVTVLLALGRGRPALTDLNTVLWLKLEMTSARMQRAGLHLKMGEIDRAHVDLEEVGSLTPHPYPYHFLFPILFPYPLPSLFVVCLRGLATI